MISLGATAWLLHKLIPVFVHRKMGQTIYELGPYWHKNKANTPSMGGLCFVAAIIGTVTLAVVYKVISDPAFDCVPIALALLLALMNSFVGFIDDYMKIIKKQNEGLNRKQKLLLQFLVALVYLALVYFSGTANTVLRIPFSNRGIDLGFWYYLILPVIIVGFANATNITDGLDGLASSISSVVAILLIAYAFTFGQEDLLVLSGAFLGGMLGFLIFNHHPAKVFMGDTGSLFLGGFFMGVAVMTGQLLMFLIAGLVFIFDMLTSLLQILYAHFNHGKRLFLKAPYHHALELHGWSETQILTLFSGLTALFSGVAYISVL